MTSAPLVDYKKEVRFAVVMYGGVSLAIYINGVTQELFKMVRATAAVSSGNKERLGLSGSPTASLNNSLVGTETVYRKISHLLSDEQLLLECRRLADEALSTNGEHSEELKKTNAEELTKKLDQLICDNSRKVQTGFIVDILSGTSAGGINSIYLAKALANEQRIDRLKQLWINEGDIGLLLNDKVSLAGTDLLPQDPPQSLLNSRRMYLKLLRALDDMDRDNPIQKNHKSPYTRELDLFITATDIEGVPVPLKLSDKIVYERRHRNVFHFEYQAAEDSNDFLADSNPFLAFAARCTSSFPFAFEPMRLNDIDEVLELLPEYRDKPHCKSDSPRWRKYFREVLDPLTGVPNLRFARRSFGDGGYLDNKPFTYAIESLVRRQSDVPVDRRLIYIEPSPEHPEDVPLRDFRPDALANVKAALLDLPTYETIREDLQRVLQRNALIDRVHHITSGIEADINRVLPHELSDKLNTFIQSFKAPQTPADGGGTPGQPWAEKNLTAMIKEKGRAYLSYQKLRVAAVTDELARLIARLLNFDANSDLLLSLRCLVRAWRESTYYNDKEPTLNQFLTDYDYSHRIRRLTFIREKIDALYDYNDRLQTELGAFADKHREVLGLLDHPELTQERIQQFRNSNPDIGWLMGLLRSAATLHALNEDQRKQLRDVLIVIKCEVNEVYKTFQKKARLLRQRRSQAKQNGSSGEVNPILKPFEEIGIEADHLNALLGIGVEQTPGATNGGSPTANEDDCRRAAEEFLERNSGQQGLKTKLAVAADALKESIAETVKHCRARMNELLDPHRELTLQTDKARQYVDTSSDAWVKSEILSAVREYLYYYYQNFEEYDQISFPIFYEADIGEASIVEVIRVSPEDATSLIDEREEKRKSPTGIGRQKLAGVALHHFGAFLDRTWRQNDIMWGRLDGAERLISSLLPGSQNANLRSFLIEEAHTSILVDELPPESRLQLGGLVSEALVRASAGEPMESAVAKVTEQLKKDVPVRAKLEAIIRGSLDNEDLLEFIRIGYEVNRKLDPKPMLRSISRSTQIIGKVFENVANANQLDGKSLAWIARLGQLFWGLVEIAVPNTIRNMLFNHWLSVIYAFEIFTVVVGLVLSSQPAQQFGWTALGITAVLNVVVLVLKDVMRGRRAVFRATAVLVCLIILGLSALGLIEILGPVFGVRVGPGGNLYPMVWLKETLKQRLPSDGFFGRNLFSLLGLAGLGIVLILLNGVFGLVSFSWLDKRWELWKSWFLKSRWRTLWPYSRFRKISVLADDIEDKSTEFPGRPNTYLVPFTLSAEPPAEWRMLFETNFKQAVDEAFRRRFAESYGSKALSDYDEKLQQARKKSPPPQVTISNCEALVLASADELDNVFALLSYTASETNKQYEKELQIKAEKNYRRRQQLLADPETLDAEIRGVPETIRTKLRHLRSTATNKAFKRPRLAARLVGALTVVMGLTILLTMIMSFRQVSTLQLSLPGGFHAPGLALQRARSTNEAGEIIKTAGQFEKNAPKEEQSLTLAGKGRLTQNILVDWFVIFYYLLTLSLLAYWLSRGTTKRAQGFALLAGLATFVAASADVVENNATLSLLNQQSITLDAVESVYAAATVKWTAIFVVLMLLALLLWRRKMSPFRILSLMLVSAAVIGFVGLLVRRAAIEWGFAAMAVSLFALGLVFLFLPRRLEARIAKPTIKLRPMVKFKDEQKATGSDAVAG